jgi:hypothetical protein
MTETAAPAEPIPFRVLLDEAMRQTRRHFGKIYLPVAIPLAVLTAAVVFAQAQWMSSFTTGANSSAVFSGAGCMATVVSAIGALVLQFLSYGVLMAAAADGATGRPIDMGPKWGFILQPPVLGTLVISFLAVLVGLIFLVIPGIYIGLMLSFVMPVMVLESPRGRAAMQRSWELARYNPSNRLATSPATKIFLLYLVAWVIGWAVGAIIQLPFTAIWGVTVFRQASKGGPVDPQALMEHIKWMQLPTAILSSLASTAVRLYSSFGVVLLYLDVLRRKEGSDLAAAINARFGQTPPPPPPAAPA